MNTAPHRIGFAHRANEDGTFDSICLSCFKTIATSKAESSLGEGERSHACDPDECKRFQENSDFSPDRQLECPL